MNRIFIVRAGKKTAIEAVKIHFDEYHSRNRPQERIKTSLFGLRRNFQFDYFSSSFLPSHRTTTVKVGVALPREISKGKFEKFFAKAKSTEEKLFPIKDVGEEGNGSFSSNFTKQQMEIFPLNKFSVLII